MGGKASQQWGTTVRHGAYRLLLPPPSAAPSTEVAEVVEQAEPMSTVASAIADADQDQWTEVTHTNANGGLSVLGRLLIRFWLTITIHRRTMIN